MINIENCEEVSRLAIQAKTKDKKTWFTVSNFPIGTNWRKGMEDLENWKKEEPDSTFRLIRADIIVKIETIQEL